MPLEAAELEHPPRSELARRILEHAPERPPVGRLRVLPARDEICHGCLDFGRRTRHEAILDAGDHLPRRECRVAVGESDLRGYPPVLAVGGYDERPGEHVRPVASVRAGVHEDPAACSARNGARELEATQSHLASAMETDRVRRPPARFERPVGDRNGRQLAREPDDEGVDALVRREDVRAEPDRENLEPLVARVSQCGNELGHGPRTHERAGRSARPDRRQS